MEAASWRTAFVRLREEKQSIESLVQDLLLFSESPKLISVGEVTSDVTFLLELLLKSVSPEEDGAHTYLHTLHLIHRFSQSLEFNSSSCPIVLDFLQHVLQCLSITSNNNIQLQAVIQILDLLRNRYGTNYNNQLLHLLVHVVAIISNVPSSTLNNTIHLWDYQTIAFNMIADTVSTIGSSLSPQSWHSTLEVLRKVMDAMVSKTLLVQDSVMSRFYTSLLHCLHLLLSDPKGSLSEHVAGFVAALRMFFVYGLTNRSPLAGPDTSHKEEFSYQGRKSILAESTRPERGAYRPPHLRKREGKSMPRLKASNSQSLSDNEPHALGFTSSDSEHSDSDGFAKDVDNFRSSKTRLAAIICIQDLCQIDLKAVTAHLTMLLPTSDVLQPRKYEATLMTCLLFDPVVKARMASASTLAAMLSGPSPVFLQVAEYKESTKRGSFTALSSSLGQILMQLHTGILYLLQRESHNGLLATLFKVLMLLISATPYARMPEELLPSVISTLRTKMIDGFPSRTDQAGLLAILLSCLQAAFSTSPPSSLVGKLLQEEVSKDLVEAEGNQSVLCLIFHLSERVTNPTISFEALQVLRAVSHNYPSIMAACWGQVSSISFGVLRATTAGFPSSECSIRPLKNDIVNSVGSLGERCVMAAVKVLDECLRAISGFKGTEGVLDDRSLDTPFTSECTRTKRISSAPSYGLVGPEEGTPTQDSSGSEQWCEAIEKHLPLILRHNSAMVRAASVTCFAGITSYVFFSLAKEKQDFVLSSSISAALNDEVPSVRSAACRAIGVIACFPQISRRAETLDKFIHAVEMNTHDPLVSVRITASWALANICDLLRHRASDFNLDMVSTDSKAYSLWIALLAECALRLSKDGDKIKSNAVRALGNLSRFVRFTSLPTSHSEAYFGGSSLRIYSDSHNAQTSKEVMGDPHWLGKMVQAFVSCVTTGNVKVRWNVCHALSNLFLNETLKLEDMTWAPSVFSILLLLLRDSSNYKIRIHAAAALAVPSSRRDYGSSFIDVVQGLEHVLETLDSDQISIPSSFRYRDALEKQLTSSTLHVLSLVSCVDHEHLKDFLIKKAPFLEEWLSSLKSSVDCTSNQPGVEAVLADGSLSLIRKKEMLQRTIRSLSDAFECNNKHEHAKRFKKLLDG